MSKKQTRAERRAAERKQAKAGNKVNATTATISPGAPFKANNSKWYMGLIAVLITFLCFSNVGGMDFVNWDDDRNAYENPSVVNFSTDNFATLTKDIFTDHVIGNYNPLTIFTFAMDQTFHGIDNPGPWHWENVLLHMICVFLVYRICLLLGLGWKSGLFVALLFGIHPMRVESVTWITERKDVLFGVFFLAALLIYIKNKKRPSKMNMVWITLFFILSLLSKIQAVTLPLTMLAVDYYMDDKLSWKTLFSKAHYFLLSLATGLIGIYFLKFQGSLETNESYNIIERLFIGAFSFVVYLIKVVVPYRMSPLYPYPDSIPWYFYASMVILPIVLWGLWSAHKAGKKHLVFGMMFFIFNIFFLLQILGAGQGFLADRFTYIPYLGLFFIAGYYMQQLIDAEHKLAKPVLIAGALYVGAMGMLTYNQNKIWQNSGTLWTHVLKYYKNTTLPYGNRANYYRDNGQLDQAFADYDQNIKLKAHNPQALNSRGRLYFNMGGKENMQLAFQDYSKAIEQMETTPAGPDRDRSLGEFHINLGAAYAMLDRPTEAISEFDKGLKLKPSHQSGYLNRSVIYNKLGDYPKALADIESYNKLNPYNADLWYESARLKRAMNRVAESMDDYNTAIRLNPNKAIFYYERSRTSASMGNTASAQSDLRKAIQMGYTKVDPSYKTSIGM